MWKSIATIHRHLGKEPMNLHSLYIELIGDKQQVGAAGGGVTIRRERFDWEEWNAVPCLSPLQPFQLYHAGEVCVLGVQLDLY